ncbi:unnamed protein product (macronuclear) [Paramecium tetraurelia]|uniref:Tetraspanin family protein n=1 Tax=Paramecium tetraurelia TaxID=5888 RepID=A0C1H4_PARTE|nr:uncharacterized protein GSPATT00034117001 [Paramecium tetraurelia]CAK64641.1 unnamed protein product [Paramecium tetraurelia]|eukprot:XP_001432038.1 hypothetical protein (macronuclear) [Paramecium tetraurelia strain d4-2]
MFLPIKFLKTFAFIQVFIEIGISLAAFVGAYYIYKLLSQVDNHLQEIGIVIICRFQYFITTSFLATPFFVLAFGIFAVAISGMLGTLMKEKKYLLVFFNVGNLCLGLSFVILGLIAMALDNSIEKDHTCRPSDPQYTTIQKLYSEVESVLCKDSCECYYYKEINYQVAKQVKVYSKTDQTKAINAQECDYFDGGFPLDVDVVQWMENEFDCSGWCISYPIKFFDDVNSDVKNYKYSCYTAIGNYFKTIFHISKIVFFVVSSIMGVMFVLTCCLGYHPDHQHQFKNYRKIADQKK